MRENLSKMRRNFQNRRKGCCPCPPIFRQKGTLCMTMGDFSLTIDIHSVSFCSNLGRTRTNKTTFSAVLRNLSILRQFSRKRKPPHPEPLSCSVLLFSGCRFLCLLRNKCETKVALCAMILLKMTIFCAKMLLLLRIDFCFV